MALITRAEHSKLCERLYCYMLRHIWRVGLLPQDVAKTLAYSIVSSRLDYCNAVLYGTPNSTTSKLQKVQNCLARVVLQQRMSCHAQPLLKSLHWLPNLSGSTSNWQLWLSRYSLLRNPNTFISWSPVNTLVHRWHCAHQLVLYSKYHAPELAAVLQPYQLSGTIFQPQLLKQTFCLFSVVDSRHICALLLSKTVVNCN